MPRHMSRFVRHLAMIAACWGILTPALCAAQKIPGTGKKTPTITGAAPSDAEQIAKLRRSIEATQKRLAELSTEVANPQSEYARQAEAEFQKVDEELERKKKALAAIPDDGTPAKGKAQAAKIQGDIQALEKSWNLAKDRFDLAIEERKTLKEQIGTLEEKLEGDREAYDKLSGTAEPEKDEAKDKPHAKDQPEHEKPHGKPRPAESQDEATPSLIPKAAESKDKDAEAEKDAEQAKAEEREKQEAEERNDAELSKAKEEEKEKERPSARPPRSSRSPNGSTR
ncbi:MAG: hypothetical protein U0800_19145 [Isosphaeraceae bacterium]